MKKIISTALTALLLAAPCLGQTIGGGAPNPQSPLSLSSGFVAGRFYSPVIGFAPANVALPAANRLFATPFFVPSGRYTIKTLSFDIGTGNASAWNARMCVYTDSAGAPAGLVPSGDTGTVAIGSGSVTGVQTGNVNGATGVVVSGPAWYWLGFMADSASESLYSINNNQATILGGSLLGVDSSARLFTNVVSGVYVAQSFGACPDPFGAITLNANAVTPFLVVGF